MGEFLLSALIGTGMFGLFELVRLGLFSKRKDAAPQELPLPLQTPTATEEPAHKKQQTETEKARYEAILKSIGDGMIVTDKKGEIVFVNGAAENFLGFTKDDLLEKSFSQALPLHDEKNAVVDPMTFVLTSGRKQTHATYYFVRKDKTSFPAATTIAPIILNLNWEMGGVVVSFRDITKEKEVDRMKTEFVSIASHQLRTPLASINWNTEMMFRKEVGQLTERQRKYLQEIYNADRRMTALVNALLNVSRIELGTFMVSPKPTDIKEVINSILEDIHTVIEKKKLEVQAVIDTTMPLINVDTTLIRMVCENLITNAVKYTPVGGKVTVSVGIEKEEIFIRVADTGYGIPVNSQSKIFTKLFRADNIVDKETDGTGLGLYIVRSIVEQSGGRIAFTSQEGKGTMFSVTWPKSGMQKKEGKKGLT